MKYRTLGEGLTVSAIGIGCMPMIRGGNIAYGEAREDESIATIPGVKRRETMRDSVGSPDVSLSENDLVDLDAAAPKGTTAGLRYGERGMRMVNL
jgi:aryl-alcohol dehydrogenase-like predicted oxidoreductase